MSFLMDSLHNWRFSFKGFFFTILKVLWEAGIFIRPLWLVLCNESHLYRKDDVTFLLFFFGLDWKPDFLIHIRGSILKEIVLTVCVVMHVNVLLYEEHV